MGSVKLAFLVLLGVANLASTIQFYFEKYAITDSDYIGAFSQGYDSEYRIKRVYLHSENIGGPGQAQECKKHCIKYPNCYSFVVHKSKRICYLNNYDRCKNPGIFLKKYDDFTTYELRDNLSLQKEILTCFQQCILSDKYTCDQCGRAHCSGEKCHICKISCWDLTPRIYGQTHFWTTLKEPMFTLCKGEWHVIMTKGVITQWSYLWEEPVWLRVEVFLSTNETKISYFSSFSFNNGIISVGDYVGGDAGNTWDAPFTDRVINGSKKTNCFMFYYNEPCYVPQLPSYEEQVAASPDPLNPIIKQKGFIWEICDYIDELNQTYVTNIQLQITPIANNSDYNDIFFNSLRKVSC